MADLSKEEQFLLKEYDAAQQLTYHVDDLRAKLTQFFLIFTGFATTALTLLVKGEAKTTVFGKPEGAVALLILVCALLGGCFVAIIARLRRAQIEHFRITNNVRSHFLKNDYKLWNVVELSATTIPEPSRKSGSYFWVLLIIVATAYLYLLTFYVHLTKVFNVTQYNTVYIVCGVVFLVMVVLHDRLYFRFAQPPKPPTYSLDNPPTGLQAHGEQRLTPAELK